MSRIKRIGLVDHCGADTFILSRFIHRIIPDVPIEQINGMAKLDGIARSDSLLLINRVLVGAFATTNGVELIRKLVQMAEPPVVTLISSHQDAQADAQDAGTRPGFRQGGPA